MDKYIFLSFGFICFISVIITTIAIIVLKENGYKTLFFIDKKLFNNFKELAMKKQQFLPLYYLLYFSVIAPIIMFLIFITYVLLLQN
jgi:hypothetical protein